MGKSGTIASTNMQIVPRTGERIVINGDVYHIVNVTWYFNDVDSEYEPYAHELEQCIINVYN